MNIISYASTSRGTPAKPPKKPNWFKKFKLGKLLKWLFRMVAIGLLLLAILFAYFWFTLPTPEELMGRTVPESTKIFARSGELLYELHGEYKRTLVDLKDISPFLQNATVAIEDKDFYKHRGISLWAIARTIVQDIYKRRAAGGSTITQQFVKNAALTREKSIYRKLKEVFLALQIDAKYSKEDILKFYLNEIPYGRNAYGIEAASQAYFGKSAKDLTLSESAYLAALPQAPSYYSPNSNREILDLRHQTVLKAMKDQSLISSEQEQAALQENVIFKQAKTALIAPHFVLYVQDYLISKYGAKSLQEGGYKVYTTLDLNLQKSAEQIVKESIEKNAKKYNAYNAGLVAIDPKTGQILALVGSKDYFGEAEPVGCTPGKNCQFEPNVNVALAERQPGSSFKPYVYLTAFTEDHKYSPASLLMDVNTNFGTFNGKNYEPKNYNGQNYGPVSMRQALAGSLNIPAVKTLALVGVDNATQTARNLGITSPLKNCGLSLVLGGCEVKLIDHTASMAVIANGGIKHEKTAILKIEDKNGQLVEEYIPQETQVVSPEATYQLTSIMTDNEARAYIFGTNSPLAFSERSVACKTGTTNNWRDGWTMCFTPNISVGVWSGNNNGELLKKGADGVYVAAPIVKGFLTEAFKTLPKENFQRPGSLKDVVVDSVSGKLPTQFSPNTKTEIFAPYNEPKDYDPIHVGIKINTQTGEPATELTPPDLISIKTYTVFHSEQPNNPNWENPVISWATEKGYTYPPNSGVIIPGNGENPNSAPDTFEISFNSPQDNQIILKLPFQVSLAIPPGITPARTDIYINGQFIQSESSSPTNFSINKKMPDGEHSLMVKIVDNIGSSGSTSTLINYSLNSNLYLSEPKNNSTLKLPIKFYALSSDNLGQVSFFSQKNAQTQLIGTSDPINNGDYYRYQLEVSEIPLKGEFKIFAKASNGTTSNKITVILP